MWWRGCCARHSASTTLTTRRPARRCGSGSPTPTRRTCCCSMTCSGSATAPPTCLRSTPTPGGVGWPPGQHRLAGSPQPGCVRHRGRALDRRGQRVDARRLPDGDPADAVAGADHLPPEYQARWTGSPALRRLPLRRWVMRRHSTLIAELLAVPDASVAALAVHASRNVPPVIRSSPRRSCAIWPSAVCSTVTAAATRAVRRRRVRRAGHPAGHHRRAHRPARRRRQAHPERRGGHRLAVRRRPAQRLWSADGSSRPGRRRAHRSGEVHPARRVRVPPPADPHGGLRIAAQVRSRRVAPPVGRRDRTTRPGGGERGAIAEHLEAAGDLHAAYGWHMRAGAWSIIRDSDAAADELATRAGTCADRLADRRSRPALDADRATYPAVSPPRGGRGGRVPTPVRIDELRELCSRRRRPAIAGARPAGQVRHSSFARRHRPGGAKLQRRTRRTPGVDRRPHLTSRTCSCRRSVPVDDWQRARGDCGSPRRVIDLADGDSTKGNLVLASPLAQGARGARARRLLPWPAGWQDWTSGRADGEWHRDCRPITAGTDELCYT